MGKVPQRLLQEAGGGRVLQKRVMSLQGQLPGWLYLLASSQEKLRSFPLPGFTSRCVGWRVVTLPSSFPRGSLAQCPLQ